MQNPFFKSIINRCVPVGQLKLFHTQPCVYTCVPYELQKPLESGMAAGGAWVKNVCRARRPGAPFVWRCGYWRSGPPRSSAPTVVAGEGFQLFGQTRTCGFDRRIRAQRVQALGAPEYNNAPAPTRRGAVNRSQERPNLRYLAACTEKRRVVVSSASRTDEA